jgi:hypothetical protein
MAGGIQPGTVAWDCESRKLDKNTREAAELLREHFLELRCVKRMPNKDKIKYFGDACFGFAPDGGAWFHGDDLLAVFESKKQNMAGNANERWYDNATTAQHINKNVRYHTFCTGPGAAHDGPLGKMARAARIKLGTNMTFTLDKKVPTLRVVYDVMKKILETEVFKASRQTE